MDLRRILPKTLKPSTYLNIPIINAAVMLLDKEHHESDVERAVELILEHYFPYSEGWAKTPQFLTGELKRPDRMIEKFEGDGKFRPHIHVELKSRKGDSLENAAKQSASSLPMEVDNLEGDFQMFSLIIKGSQFYPFEYHNDRSNLYEDNVPSTYGLIPFNHAHKHAVDPQNLVGRPHFRGTDTLAVGYENDKGNLEVVKILKGVGLCLLRDDVDIQNVILWMKSHKPLVVTRSGNSGG